VYDYPKYSIFLGELVDTDPDKVAQALARNIVGQSFQMVMLP
jgi:hypothetical protein